MRNRARRRNALLVSAGLAATLASLLAACTGDGGPSGGSNPPTPPLRPVVVRETATTITISAGGNTVGITKRPFHMSLSGSGGGPEVSEPQRGMYYSIGGGRTYLDEVQGFTADEDRVVLSVESAAGVASIDVSFPLEGITRVALSPPEGVRATAAGVRLGSPSNEAIYGLLERVVSGLLDSEIIPKEEGSLDRRGTIVKEIMRQSIALYTPFFQTSRGYGIYVEGTSIGHFDLAGSDPGAIEFELELPPGVKSLAYLFLNGPSHDKILDRYTAVTGRPFLPPEWAFRHWRWRDEHRLAEPAMLDGVPMNADLVDDIQHYEDLGIPIGNYTIDRPWATGDLPDLPLPEQPGFGDLVWDEARFPNPQKMIDALNRRGYHLFLWIGPWATGVVTNREAVERGFLAPSSNYIIDFTNPGVVDWWAAKITPLLQSGIAGLKLDRGDEDTPDKATDVYADGRTGRELRNAYPVLFAKVHHDICKKVRGDDFLVYPRAGYAGSQQWAVFSAGDVPGKNFFKVPTDLGLRMSILALQHNALNGFPIWGSDTGGYEQFGDRELFARWLEFSAFSPIMEIGGVGAHAPWDMPTEPRYDEEMIDIYRRYTTMHHGLVPYLYRHAQEAHRSGRPVAKPLVFNYQSDPRVTDLWEEFLLGDDILVAPVWKMGQRTQNVYLPAGRWVDYWSRDRVVKGPVDLTEPAPFERIPIFVREGADVLGSF